MGAKWNKGGLKWNLKNELKIVITYKIFLFKYIDVKFILQLKISYSDKIWNKYKDKPIVPKSITKYPKNGIFFVFDQ